ncbi:sigma-54-dependent transcriptional regulator [Methylocella sp.]|uniref:sigma-54-dependent transcriptional regulator n=1 Tax=Methylocella sp. TaxID=1978226 RepID=UPI0037842D1F
MPPKILIVDADPVERLHVEQCVRRFGFSAETLDSGAAALARLRSTREGRIDLVILDLAAQGFETLAALRATGFAPPVVALAPKGEPPTAALEAGAFDVATRPPSPERLKIALANGLNAALLETEVRRLARHAQEGVSFADFFGAAPEMERALRLAERAARADLPALIEGETGVGKETLARAVHNASERRGRPFVSLRCSGLAPEAIEGLLFGAPDEPRRMGRIGEAQGGTLFLGDVCELPHAAQTRLLRLVAEGELAHGGRTLRVDVRVVAATRRNLIERVREGRLREDLYYRLAVAPILLPPLRRRLDEIAPLAQGFCVRFSAEHGRFSRGLSAEALNLLQSYDFPGNVRELEAATHRAAALAEGAQIGAADFPAIAARVGRLPHVPPAEPAALSAACAAPADGAFEARVPLDAPQPGPLWPQDPGALSLLDDQGDMRTLAEIEREAIRFALGHYRGRMSKMARKLGVGRSTLYRKLRDYGLGQGAADEPAAIGEAGAPPEKDADAA